MTTETLVRRAAAVYELPLAEQADCLLIAAERSLPAWQERARRLGVPDLSGELFAAFRRWREGGAPPEDLGRTAKRFYAALPQDLRLEEEPAGGYAGWALLDVALVALDQCEDLHPDILLTAVLYAAAAFCGSGREALTQSVESLAGCEEAFVKDWWEQCVRQFPRLAELMADPGWTPWYAGGRCAHRPPA